ncbi:MFS transporter [Rhodococcus sp. ABRD24]|uniref:MFS transporter n=1 Tax=Rhodococcus sp. ABRD24 TaxID=2507582 RepID=UPI00103ED7D2|nr:MFS transporter [Rhodococcus sp. ABRD24]QBJ96999.1 MFS transporter [Rhodococcus sp. ABRD24]
MTTTTSPTTLARAAVPPVTYLLAAGTFLMGTSEFVVAGLLPALATDFDVTVAQAGLSITLFAIGMIIGAPLMAILTLRLPRRVTLTLALTVFAAGHVIATLVPEFTMLLAARVLTAVATGTFWTVSSVVAASTAGPRAASRALGIVNAGGILATVLGVPLGAFCGQLIGWRGAFWALAVLAAVTAVFVALLVPADNIDRPAPSIRVELRTLRSPCLWLVLAACAGVTASVLSIYSYITPLLTLRAGLPQSVVPAVLMAFGLAALVGSIVTSRVGENHPHITALTVATITLLATIAIYALANSPVPAIALFTLLGLSGLSAIPILVGLAIRLGGSAPTLAAAMPTSFLNIGTALGTAASALALESDLGLRGPAVVGIIAAGITLIPLAWNLRSRSRFS